MEKKIIQANVRTAVGKGAAKALRRQGRLPAVIYDREGKAILIDIHSHDFQLLFRKITQSTLVTVIVDGKEHIAFIKDAQYDIISDLIKHVDFYQVEAGQTLRTKILVRCIGTPEDIRLGGIVDVSTNEVEVECLPQHLPESIDVDISDLKLNETLHVRDIVIPEGVTILTPEDVDIVSLKVQRVSVEEEEEVVEGEEGEEEVVEGEEGEEAGADQEGSQEE